MKKIIKEAVREESEKYCDITGKDLNRGDLGSKLVMSFGFGSPRDLDVLDLDLSAEAAEEIYQLLLSKYGAKLKAGYKSEYDCDYDKFFVRNEDGDWM